MVKSIGSRVRGWLGYQCAWTQRRQQDTTQILHSAPCVAFTHGSASEIVTWTAAHRGTVEWWEKFLHLASLVPVAVVRSFPALVHSGSVFSCQPSTWYEGTYAHAMTDCHPPSSPRNFVPRRVARTHTRLLATQPASTHTHARSPTCYIVTDCGHIADSAYRQRPVLLFFISRRVFASASRTLRVLVVLHVRVPSCRAIEYF